MTIKLIEQLSVQNILGEGVIYDWRDDSIWWTDIEAMKLYNYNLTNRHLQQIPTEQRLGSFALTRDSNQLLCGFESGFALFYWQTSEVRWLHQPIELQSGNGLRLNDGRLDPQGRFWCGAMVENNDRCPADQASLYCLDSNLKLHQKCSNIQISNGICWHPNQRQFYFSDSPKREMYQFSYDVKRGAIDNRQLFAKTARGHYPDGAVTDSHGYLWSAQWGGAKVVRYNPRGEVDLTLAVPIPQPSCVGFGGAAMNLLFVTSARQDLSAEQLGDYPQSGDLFIYHTEYQGIREPCFNYST